MPQLSAAFTLETPPPHTPAAGASPLQLACEQEAGEPRGQLLHGAIIKAAAGMALRLLEARLAALGGAVAATLRWQVPPHLGFCLGAQARQPLVVLLA